MAQLGSVDLTVIVPESPASTVPLTPGQTREPVPQQGRPPSLAFTGIDAGVLLMIAVALVAVGILLHRLSHRSPSGPPPPQEPR